MAPRSELQAILEGLLGSDQVYFQPPPTVQMQYPCIVYSRDYAETAHADNGPYKRDKRYSVTVISYDVDSDVPDKIAGLPKCVFDRFYTANNLNHDVFKLFF